MKIVTSLTALIITTSMIAACSPTDLPPGKYEKKEVSTDRYGTKYENKTSTEVDQDAYGNKRATVKTKTTQDPKGLFNKSTTSESEKVIEEKTY